MRLLWFVPCVIFVCALLWCASSALAAVTVNVMVPLPEVATTPPVVTVPPCPRCVIAVPVIVEVKPIRKVADAAAKAAVGAGKAAVKAANAVADKAVEPMAKRSACANGRCDIKIRATGLRVRLKR